MYKVLFRICLLAVIISAVYSCQKDDAEKIVTITPETLDFISAGETKNVELAANASWRIVVPRNSGWCQVSPAAGKGDASITVSVKPNLIPVQRSVDLQIKYEDKSVTLQVRQEALDGTGNYVDGEVRYYQINRQDKPVNLVFLGDGFIAADYAENGVFDNAVAEAAEAIFNVEPYKTYREYFNIYKIATFSEERGATYQDLGVLKNTCFGTAYTGGSGMKTDDDKVFSIVNQIPGINIDQTGIILIVNNERYAGTTMLYSTGRSIAICPMNRASELPGGFGPIVIHEAGGHGFGQLADEYTNDEPTPPSADEIKDIKLWFGFNFYQNVDLTDDLSQIKWSDFIGRPGYEAVAAYEGAFYHEVGIWRPEYISCMNDNRSYFNTPSRAAIVKRILAIAGETYTQEGFIAKDVVKSPPLALTTKPVTSKLPRLAPPVLKDNR